MMNTTALSIADIRERKKRLNIKSQPSKMAETINGFWGWKDG